MNILYNFAYICTISQLWKDFTHSSSLQTNEKLNDFKSTNLIKEKLVCMKYKSYILYIYYRIVTYCLLQNRNGCPLAYKCLVLSSMCKKSKYNKKRIYHVKL